MRWDDRLFNSSTRIGPLVIWIDEGAEGWRIHVTLDDFIIAPRKASRDEAKKAAEAIIKKVFNARL